MSTIESPPYAVYFEAHYTEEDPTTVIVKLTVTDAYHAIALTDRLNTMPIDASVTIIKTSENGAPT